MDGGVPGEVGRWTRLSPCSGRDSLVRARQVFDERLAHGARSIASSRKGRRVGSCKGLVRVKDGRLVAR
jgi:hypothetical protein